MIPKSAVPVRVALCFELDQQYHRDVLVGVLDYLRGARCLKPLRIAGMPVQKTARLPYLEADAMLGFFHGAYFESHEQSKPVPTVTVSNTREGEGLAVVCSDDRAVGRMAAAYLNGLGLKHLACLGRWPGYAAQRVNGFEEAAKAAGTQCTVFEPSQKKRWLQHLLSAESELGDWLQLLERPCGVYCVDDTLAFAVHSLAHERGLRVPDDLAILGTDNNELLTQLLDCPLSSIELDTHQIGYHAARILDDHFAGTGPFPVRIEIPPLRVVVRASTNLLYHDDPVVAKILARTHAQPGLPWAVDQLCEGVGLSRRAAEIRFRKRLGCGIYDHLIHHRIDRAKALLLETDWSVGRIAEHLGFCDQRQLGVLFRKRTGMSPTELRTRHLVS